MVQRIIIWSETEKSNSGFILENLWKNWQNIMDLPIIPFIKLYMISKNLIQNSKYAFFNRGKGLLY